LEELQSTTRKIREHGARATAIVNGMAMHARKSGGEREATDLNSLLAQSVMLATRGARGQRRDVQISTDYDASAGNLYTVAQDLSRVFVNLINNALYAVEQKSIRLGSSFVPLINVRTIDLGDHLQVRVRDNGDGIASGLLSKVFTPFFTTKPSGQGSGLGLSISHDIIVRGHGGDLRAESVEGEYAEFIVTLPRRQDYAG
jgi:signal transduction histidine kinase